ncbi:UPF0489 family protein [Flavobacterium sp. WW92]|uniref:UPF0489 family protein n=1 Tax=unclassified Flavobacterium TaxID=196869 RepID=UPI00222564E4|nr:MULTISPECIES: UPF0489 family protein [unclassified Flavobacterium]WDO12357.1 UPF0489 family protein [Flavobacterium sp. WW92]
MWIKEPNNPLQESSADNLNFLYRFENVFIMDNHLAAGWSWLNTLDTDSTYKLLHVDRHYDLLDYPQVMQSEIIDKNIQIHSLELQEYLDLRRPIGNNQTAPIFRWDNYIGNLNILYPDLFAEKFFCTHRMGNRLANFITEDFETYDLLANLNNLVDEENGEVQWIVNVDLDFFFGDSYDDRKIVLFSEVYIRDFFSLLRMFSDRVAVFTFCMSPECCGGWENAYCIIEIIKEIFHLDFELELP